MSLPFSTVSRFKSAFLFLVLTLGCRQFAFGASALVHVPADKPTLQDAIAEVTDGGIIEMAGGTYTAPSGAFTVLDYNKGFTVRAAAGATVTLSGGGSTDIIRLANSPGRVARTIGFERIRFSNGVSTNNFIGGGVTVVRINATFVGCTFDGNSAIPAVSGGGAIWFETAQTYFQDCTFTNNSSPNYGGAIAMTGSQSFFRNCTFIGNRTDLPNHGQTAIGGAIFSSDSSIQADNCRFENNHAGLGGGAIYCGGHWTTAIQVAINNSLFLKNSAMNDPSVTINSAPLGGAIFVEDNVDANFSNTRFIENFALQGGAISSYRTNTVIDRCTFLRNHADGTKIGESLGGSIVALSADNVDASSDFGTTNRRSIILTIRDTLFRGDGVSKNALQGGAIFASGDLNAAYGLNGVKQNGTPDSNRAQISLTRVAFADLVTANIGSIPGSAGAIGGAFSNLSMDSSIVENCSTTDIGGAFELVQNSVATIQNSIIAACKAGTLGGALTMLGGILDLHNSSLVENKSANSQGGALGSAPAPASGDGVPDTNFEGLVQNCVLSKNTGGPTSWEGDRVNSPFNRIGYGGNQFFMTGGLPAFYSQVTGNLTVAQLNNIVIPRSDGTQTKKAPFPNTEASSAPIVGAILMLPPTPLPTGAPGETVPIPSNLVYASSGGAATVDGTAQGTNSGVIATTTEGTHVLNVGGVAFSTPPPPPAFAANISTRLPVSTGQNVLIGGFIIQGPSPKRVIVRAIGPSLSVFFSGVLQDPVLELHDGTGATIATNDSWLATQTGAFVTSDQAFAIRGTGLAPSDNNECAIIATLNPGNYTAIVRGANNSTGIAVVEVFDLDPIPTSTLANIATRGFIQTGDNVMIGGFIYQGGIGATKVVVRGIGPSLQAAGITNPLADPMLELHDQNGATIASNDDWRQSPDAAAIQAANLQPSNDAESAILQTALPRGNYTAIVRGKNGGTGVGVVEAYIF